VVGVPYPEEMSMALKATRVPAYGVKVPNSLKGKDAGRAYLYVMANDLHKRPFGLLEELIATSRHARNRVHALYARLGFTDHGKEFRMDFS
jgi:hypothetical protein